MDLTIRDLPCVCVPLEQFESRDTAAIYIVIARDVAAQKYSIIDIGQSGQLSTRIGNHPREDCWQKKARGRELWVCVYQMPTNEYSKQQRLELENELRNKVGNDRLCGDR